MIDLHVLVFVCVCICVCLCVHERAAATSRARTRAGTTNVDIWCGLILALISLYSAITCLDYDYWCTPTSATTTARQLDLLIPCGTLPPRSTSRYSTIPALTNSLSMIKMYKMSARYLHRQRG